MKHKTTADENPIDDSITADAAERHDIRPNVLADALRRSNHAAEEYLYELTEDEDRVKRNDDERLVVLERHGHHWEAEAEHIIETLNLNVSEGRLAKAMRMAHDEHAKRYWSSSGFRSKQQAVGGVGHADAIHVQYERDD